MIALEETETEKRHKYIYNKIQYTGRISRTDLDYIYENIRNQKMDFKKLQKMIQKLRQHKIIL